MRVFDLDERSKMVRGFPGYEVTNYGRVYNLTTGREMAWSATLRGDITVGLMRDGVQHRRSVKNLVARAFVPGETERFDTPVLLDGNKQNLHESNIVWRPRWFAWKYSRQFKRTFNWYFYGPVADKDTEQQWPNVIEASIANGVLCEDVRRSIYSNDYRTFPTKQKFAYVV